MVAMGRETNSFIKHRFVVDHYFGASVTFVAGFVVKSRAFGIKESASLLGDLGGEVYPRRSSFSWCSFPKNAMVF